MSIEVIKTVWNAANQDGRTLRGVLKEGGAIVQGRIKEREPPEHLPDQRELVHEWFDTDEERWLIVMDAGRYDYFEQLVWEYFDGNLQRAWNGGVGYTGNWSERTLRTGFGNRALYSWVSMGEFQSADYNPLEWFEYAPDIYSDASVQERLAALGYMDGSIERKVDVSPTEVNKEVRNTKGEYSGGVVRYLKPHPPFDGLMDLTSESTKTLKTNQALNSGELSYQDLHEAYERTYHIAFEAAADLIPDLDGRVMITSDHGTCLYCGQLFHGSGLEKHDHLTHVPWFEVDAVL